MSQSGRGRKAGDSDLDGVIVAPDNTTATPYPQQPLALGAAYVIASDTKSMTGNSDVVLGQVAAIPFGKPFRGLLSFRRAYHGAADGGHG